MPSTSAEQHRFMAMASTPEGRAKLRSEGHKMPPEAVATEFRHADKGRHFSRRHMAKRG